MTLEAQDATTLPVDVPIPVPLCCYVSFEYMEGVTEFELQLEVMRGREVVQRTPAQKYSRSSAVERHHQHVMNFGTFLFPGAGDFMFAVLVRTPGGDTLRFSRKFTVRVDRVGGAPSAPATRKTH
jgi:hypothetical protein